MIQYRFDSASRHTLKMRSLITICFVLIAFDRTIAYDNMYSSKRSQILEQETLLAVGGKTQLSDKEAVVNNCLMQYKFNECDYGFDNPANYNFSRHYFKYKNKIKDSSVYKIIKDMPKGATLHVHDMAMMKPDYLMNITYMDDLYVCFENGKVHFLFATSIPNITTCPNKWQLMRKAREAAGDIHKFDEDLRRNFTIVCNNPDVTYPSISESWARFLSYFGTVVSLLSYRPVWEKYFFDALKSFRDDNIMYVEVRSILPNLYELDGTAYDPVITAKAYRKSIKRFVQKYPDFIGAKLIYAPSRMIDRYQLSQYLATARKLKEDVSEIFAGFDLVGAEDRGNPLIEFVPQLEAAAADLDYFFHAGETDWYGTTTDDNLVDAILLGAKRIGHAYALPKHPMLMKEVLKRDIGLEVNVISNTVLSLVRDVRNHPLATFLANGLPVVLSSDDPGVWEADPISHDFYIAFVGVASRLSDLRLLKTLATNSLKYSALSATEKLSALSKFNQRWNDFVNNFDCSKYAKK